MHTLPEDRRTEFRLLHQILPPVTLLTAQSAHPGSNYDPIASEYYATGHDTSRAFDAATTDYFSTHSPMDVGDGLLLEVGAGTGSSSKHLNIPENRIVQSDISEAMLLLEPRERSWLRVRCDARDLPFLPSSFSAVTAFLFDPYNTLKFFEQVRRVLRVGGVFIGTLPNATWGFALRDSMGHPRDQAIFRVRSGETIAVRSILSERQALKQQLTQAGLSVEQIVEVTLPTSVHQVPHQIAVAADYLKVHPYSLPIVLVVQARRIS